MFNFIKAEVFRISKRKYNVGIYIFHTVFVNTVRIIVGNNFAVVVNNRHCTPNAYKVEVSHGFPCQRFAFYGVESGFRYFRTGFQIEVFNQRIAISIYRPQRSRQTHPSCKRSKLECGDG